MRDILVALDLETTGLDARRDRIIEIGAVKFENGKLLGEWHTLINPGIAIPAYVTRLTGITDQDVADSPSIAVVLPRLREFVGNAAIVGHNIRFDLSFLAAGGLRTSSSVIDTYAVASVLLPDTPRYSLTALASLFEIPTDGAHRALNDAHTTRALFEFLWNHVCQLPLNVLAEIVRHSRQMAWDGALPFENALKDRAHELSVSPDPPADGNLEPGSYPPVNEPTSDQRRGLRPSGKIAPLDVEALASLAEPGGPLAQSLPGYEERPQQVRMIRAVCEALNSGQHVMVEAPTGVGKSLAYLAPAVHFALQNNDRVVISTNTINLQEQLINKDIPLLQSALAIPFRSAVLKGRANYLCPRRLTALRRRGPTSPEEMLMLARILVWLTRNQSGDRGEITLRGPVEGAVWHRLSAEDEGCKLERCASQMAGSCPFYRARRAADSAHILIVNHSLLLSDVAADGRVLPDYRHLIIDEAHHLEEAVTNGLSFRTDPSAVERQLADLGTATSGLLGEVLRQCRGAIPPGYFSTLNDFVSVVAQASSYMSQHVDLFFREIQRFLEEHVSIRRNEYTQQIRILSTFRRQAEWEQVETQWGNLSQFTSAIAEAMTRLASGLAELSDYDIEQYEDLLAGATAAARHLGDLHNRLGQIATNPDPNAIYWAEFPPGSDRITLHAAPLAVGPLVSQHLWAAKETVILTSATLRTNGTFHYLRQRLDAQHVSEVTIDSPFDYKNSTLLYVPTDIPEPADQAAYQRAAEAAILRLCQATEGRALILFTSYAQLKETANAISDALGRDGIVVYDQTDGSSRSQLLDGFVQSEKAVLMGTRSFWEGIDIPGADLSVLVIMRLPFTVPSDPLFAARSEQFEESFTDYAVPEAILRFRQGFGRLIRRKDDRGVVAILDRRIVSKRYGQQFLESLPECTLKQGPIADLPSAAAEWLARS